MTRVHFQTRSQSGRKAIGKCKGKGNMENKKKFGESNGGIGSVSHEDGRSVGMCCGKDSPINCLSLNLGFGSTSFGSCWSEESSEGSDSDEWPIFARERNSTGSIGILFENRSSTLHSSLDLPSKSCASEKDWSEESSDVSSEESDCPIILRNTRISNHSSYGNCGGFDFTSESSSSDGSLWFEELSGESDGDEHLMLTCSKDSESSSVSSRENQLKPEAPKSSSILF